MANTSKPLTGVTFYKYQGTGNDFIMVDNRKGSSSFHRLQLDQVIPQLCHRRFGIGADGVILIQNQQGFDFRMVYCNSDGIGEQMCGNGARCAMAFAKHLGIIRERAHFLAKDGAHEGRINPETSEVQVKIIDVSTVTTEGDLWVLDTGVPHCVRFVQDVDEVDVFSEGRKVRYSERFKAIGVNVNFVAEEEEEKENQDAQNNGKRSVHRMKNACYERGVECETFSCGTGATASAISVFYRQRKLANQLSLEETGVPFVVSTKGGELSVEFDYVKGVFTNIWMGGPAQFVFKGEIKI